MPKPPEARKNGQYIPVSVRRRRASARQGVETRRRNAAERAAAAARAARPARQRPFRRRNR